MSVSSRVWHEYRIYSIYSFYYSPGRAKFIDPFGYPWHNGAVNGFVIFDMDGVIIDSEPTHIKIEQELFSAWGLPVTREQHAGYLGVTSHDMFRDIERTYPREWNALKLTVDRAVTVERDAYMRVLKNGEVPFVLGAVEAMTHLHALGWSIAIASSAPIAQIDTVVTRGSLEEVVGATVSGDEVTRGKPDPEIFLTAADRLEAPVRECWVVEDSPNGIRAALAANMRCVAYVPGGSRSSSLPRATASIASMAELAPLVLGNPPAGSAGHGS